MKQEELITIERSHYHGLLVRLDHLESEWGRSGPSLHGPSDNGFYKRLAMVLVALMMVGVMAAGALGAIFTGNQYISTSERGGTDLIVGYIMGVIDAFGMATIDKDMASSFYKNAGGMTISQIKAIAEKYMEDHPEDRHLNMALILWKSVSQKHRK